MTQVIRRVETTLTSPLPIFGVLVISNRSEGTYKNSVVTGTAPRPMKVWDRGVQRMSPEFLTNKGDFLVEHDDPVSPLLTGKTGPPVQLVTVKEIR